MISRAHSSLPRPLLAFLLLPFAVTPGRALAPDPLPRAVSLEHNLEIPEAGSPELHWQLRIPIERLVFRRRTEGYVAELRVACRAERKGDGRVENALWRERLSKPDFASSRDRDEVFEKRFHMPLGPGKWKVEALIYGRGSASPWGKTLNIEVPAPESGSFFLQGPRWPGRDDEGHFSPPFRFEDPWGLSEERSRFADGLHAGVPVECDLIFWDEPGGPLEAILSVEDRSGELAYYAREMVTAAAGRSALSWSLPIGRMSMGAYRVRVDLVGPGEERRVEGRLDVGLTSAAFGRDWDTTRSLLLVFSEEEELDEMDFTLEQERPRFWRAFWERRDPDGAAGEGTALAAFSQRLTQANLRFRGGGFRPGYLSDRGRVYLEHGEPDRIETYQDDRTYRIIHYWQYTRLGLTYVFEDRHGHGDFVLMRVTG